MGIRSDVEWHERAQLFSPASKAVATRARETTVASSTATTSGTSHHGRARPSSISALFDLAFSRLQGLLLEAQQQVGLAHRWGQQAMALREVEVAP